MKILMQGNLEMAQRKIKKTLSFLCDICGCMWEADTGEYVYCGNQMDGDEWKMNCPCCKHITYSNKKVGW